MCVWRVMCFMCVMFDSCVHACYVFAVLFVWSFCLRGFCVCVVSVCGVFVW